MDNNYNSNNDIVIASKITLVRNLSDTVFVRRMSNDIAKSVSKKVFACIKNSPLGKEFDLINLQDLSKAKAQSYVEKGLISDRFISNEKANSFLLSKDNDISVMINEEEHIKITAYEQGDNIIQAYNKANDVDDVFINGLRIAFSPRFGFLTSSPMYLGTGLKASLILHLPALNRNNLISRLSSMVNKLGMSLNSAFENQAGDIFVLSNHDTLGVTEKAALDNLNAVSAQIIMQERNARQQLKGNADFEDKLYRNLGILKLARKLSTEEMLGGLSLVRLACSLGYFDYSINLLNEMLANLFNATLVDSSNSDLSQSMCEALRAQIIREKLA